jgi:hypothetical protein
MGRPMSGRGSQKTCLNAASYAFTRKSGRIAKVKGKENWVQPFEYFVLEGFFYLLTQLHNYILRAGANDVNR